MVQQLTVRQLRDRLGREGGRPVILDVRELDRQAELVVVCHHGIRSQQVASYLARQGFSRVYNLRGGVDAWAREVDPGMAKY